MTITQKSKDMIKRCMSVVLALVMIVTGVGFVDFTKEVNADTETITLYFIDNTAEKWVKNDNAVIQLVDNTNGHDYYDMVKVDDVTWSASVPKSAYNITFNRLNPSKSTQWNSWSAGGRDSNNAYYADGAEYGHWDVVESDEEENYFHAGDIVYLDVSEFTVWKNDNAIMYINFTDASKDENNGNDIIISSANDLLYSPSSVNGKVSNNVYAYVVSKVDEGKTVLRFWRGSSTVLWNCSSVLSYEDYKNGNNCVKIKNWNDVSQTCVSIYEIEKEADTDQDGLIDYYELIFGCDINIADSDNDGLTDAQEVYLVGSNPIKYDSITTGVADSQGDIDEDGLSNIQEINLGTDPTVEDTDEDGLNDGQEVSIYNTLPDNEDTDGDTLSDGDEIALGLNPLLQDTDADGILDGNEKFYQTKELEINNTESSEIVMVSVDFEGTGYIESTTSIEDIYGIDSYVTDTVGLVGSPVQIESTSNFDTAKISFYFDDELITNDELENMMIVWYNEEDDIYVEQQTVVDSDNLAVYANVNHFSKYMIVDSEAWYDIWRNEIQYFDDDESLCDTVITLDCSGSMSVNDPNFSYTYYNTLYPGSLYSVVTNYRKLAAKNFINAKSEDDKIAVVLFDNSANVACSLTNNMSVAIDALNSIYSSGGTNFNNAISASINQLTNSNQSVNKSILFLSDGEATVSNDILNAAINNSIVINTIYVGSGNDSYVLQYMANQTGGEYFKAKRAEDLLDIYNELSIAQKIDKTDTDEDGIPDIYEIVGMRTSNGKLVKTDPEDPDSDGDGLLDGEEILPAPTYWLKAIFGALGIEGNVDTYLFHMKSDPNKIDSDGDGLQDGRAIYDTNSGKKLAPKDEEPMRVNWPRGLWKEHIAQLSSGERVAHMLGSWYDFDANISWDVRDWNWGEIATGLGSRALMFKSDKENIAVHSQVETWQSIGGYNDLYDKIFHVATNGNMDKLKLPFKCDDGEYILWAWRGDYLNLGSGAEIGIYTNVRRLGGFEHWEVDEECALPMKLYLYNYYSSTNIHNIFCWEPYAPQWWITGFNPDFDNPNVHDMISIGVIDLHAKTQMYDAIKNDIENKNKKYFIFDDDSYNIWFIWGEF